MNMDISISLSPLHESIILCILFLIFRLSLIKRYPKVNSKESFTAYFLMSIVVTTTWLIYILTAKNVKLSQLGFDRSSLLPGFELNLYLLMIIIPFLYLLTKGKHIVNKNMMKTFSFYIVWGLIQQFIVMVILFGTFTKVMHLYPALLITGFVFAAFHWGDWPLFFVSWAAGILWLTIYNRYPNVIPFSLSHAVLGTLYYYWYQGIDKWDEITGKIKLRIRRKKVV